jgi:hypothetical protein
MEKIILQHNAQSHTIFLCVERLSKELLGNSPPSTIQSRPSPLRQPFVSIFKELEARQVLCNE